MRGAGSKMRSEGGARRLTALYIILGIIAFICLVLLIKVRIDAEYIDGFKLSVSWLFLHFGIYPKAKKEKKPPKPKKEKPEKFII